MSDKQKIKVTVQTTEEIMYTGEVDWITSVNEFGKFDIYPMHANFISIINSELSLYSDKQKIKNLKFEQAILKVKKDIVEVFLGIEVLKIN